MKNANHKLVIASHFIMSKSIILIVNFGIEFYFQMQSL